MAWLLHNYFLPTLNPSAPSSAPVPPLRPLAPLLKQYKVIMKATTRDTTLHVQYRAELNKLFRDVERWIAEAKVASTSAVGGAGKTWVRHVSSRNWEPESSGFKKQSMINCSNDGEHKGVMRILRIASYGPQTVFYIRVERHRPHTVDQCREV